ncbi:MAG: TPM domain-containing protein [bacterium]|nr:TPM domain-containing protein [bacterium]
MTIRRIVLLVASALLPVAVMAQTFPEHTGYVNDFANVLSPDTEVALTRSLTDYETETTNEIVVATVRSLEGSSAESYARSLHDRWGIGKSGKNNGILVLVAPTERTVWISVGSGLEAAVPSSLTQQIIDGQMLPAFRAGDYSGAVRDAVSSLETAARAGVGTSTTPGAASSSQTGSKTGIIIFGAIIAVIIGLAVLAKKKGKGSGGTGSKGTTPSSRTSFGGGSSGTGSGAGGTW